MEYVGIDLHKKESQICLLTETTHGRRRRAQPARRKTGIRCEFRGLDEADPPDRIGVDHSDEVRHERLSPLADHPAGGWASIAEVIEDYPFARAAGRPEASGLPGGTWARPGAVLLGVIVEGTLDLAGFRRVLSVVAMAGFVLLPDPAPLLRPCLGPAGSRGRHPLRDE